MCFSVKLRNSQFHIRKRLIPYIWYKCLYRRNSRRRRRRRLIPQFFLQAIDSPVRVSFTCQQKPLELLALANAIGSTTNALYSKHSPEQGGQTIGWLRTTTRCCSCCCCLVSVGVSGRTGSVFSALASVRLTLVYFCWQGGPAAASGTWRCCWRSYTHSR